MAGGDGQLRLLLPDKPRVKNPWGKPVSLADLAYWHEYGLPNRKTKSGAPNPLPARPVIAFTLRTQRGFIQKSLRTRLRLAKGKNPRISLNASMQRLGDKIVELLRREYLVWRKIKNADRTVEAKGFNNPLVWTGLLAKSWFARWFPAPIPNKVKAGAKKVDRPKKVPAPRRRKK
jgi:hypothetical protein